MCGRKRKSESTLPLYAILPPVDQTIGSIIGFIFDGSVLRAVQRHLLVLGVLCVAMRYQTKSSDLKCE